MPAVHFNIQWPDGEKIQYYCPSTVIYQHFNEGDSFGAQEFVRKVNIALDEASERVKLKFGYYCSAASAEQKKILQKFDSLSENDSNGRVTLLKFC